MPLAIDLQKLSKIYGFGGYHFFLNGCGILEIQISLSISGTG
jgi:hypothetical protein